MTDLQWGLIALGGLAVGGVAAYNLWQEKRHRQAADQALRRGHPDVLLGESPAATGEEAAMTAGLPREPGMAPMRRETTETGQGARQDSGRLEPMLGGLATGSQGRMYAETNEPPEFAGTAPATPATPAASAVPAPAPTAPAAETREPAPLAASGATPENTHVDDDPPPALISAAIDYVVSFELVEPTSGDQLLRAQREPLSRLSKPVRRIGFNARTLVWEYLSETETYARLKVGLLLANRRGPLGEADLMHFQGVMQNLADEFMAVADLPPRREALASAIHLDNFCAEVDIQIGVNVVSQGSPFAGTKIRGLAEAVGMSLDAEGRFIRCDDDGRVLYTLSNIEQNGFSAETMRTFSTHGLVLLLDVPRVPNGDRVFVQMLEQARRFSEALHGVVVDDNRQPLSDGMVDPIRRQIAQYQAALGSRGLAAGGALALRLFS